MNLLPAQVAQELRDCHEKLPELFAMDEYDLYEHLKEKFREPKPSENRLRLAFWREYSRAQLKGVNMQIARVTTGAYPRSLFYSLIITKPEKAAWLLCPPVEYLMKASEILDFGLDRLREILSVSPVDPVTKRIIPQVASAQIQVVKLMDQRLKGAAVQRIESKSLNVNVDANPSADMSMEELNKRIAELERENTLAQNVPLADPGPVKDADVIDVTPS